MIDVDWKPDARKLRQFGFGGLGAGVILGLVIAWRMGTFAGEASWTIPGAFFAFGVLCGLLAIVFPRVLLPLYVVLTAVALPIGIVVSFLIVALIYYGILTPIGLFFRLIRRDALDRHPDKSAETYWIRRKPAPPAERYYRQF